jgi:hypothetical protein
MNLIETKIPAVGFDPTTSGGVDAPARFRCAMPVKVCFYQAVNLIETKIPPDGFDPSTPGL